LARRFVSRGGPVRDRTSDPCRSRRQENSTRVRPAASSASRRFVRRGSDHGFRPPVGGGRCVAGSFAFVLGRRRGAWRRSRSSSRWRLQTRNHASSWRRRAPAWSRLPTRSGVDSSANLHDGAPQRLVSVSLSLRRVQRKLGSDPRAANEVLTAAGAELDLGFAELRELARGIHPAVLSERGLGPALESLVDRAPLPVGLELATTSACRRESRVPRTT
jgi:signal transduction histidine kinase